MQIEGGRGYRKEHMERDIDAQTSYSTKQEQSRLLLFDCCVLMYDVIVLSVVPIFVWLHLLNR